MFGGGALKSGGSLKSTTRNSGEAKAVGGGVAISGVNHGDIHLFSAPAPVTRSAYRQQVRRIAPRTLLGRDRELAELAAFCTAADGPAYVWWQAPAWAGKSALMSWFVLNPPPGVRVVSFFVTARFAGQSDRGAFVDAVLEQLAEVVGESLPTFLTDTLKEAHFLDLFERAAQIRRAGGGSLALVVDGLDEDRGVVVGPEAYSIAALLPAEPPEGTRVIVAGRPHPPVPSDVPDDHPLRDPRVVRPLKESRDAQVIRADAERELKRLLHGSAAEQSLLGLVVAAGGGLSGPDLAELTGLSGTEVEEHLCAVSGRTFAERAGQWQPGTSPTVYVLAHEELQNTAARYLGDARLEGHRRRLHAWADGYRDRGWPPGTPEYLLRGYYRLLQSTDDHDRMAAVAADQARHDRMLDVTGGDVGALTEITAVQRLIRRQAAPDLSAMTRLTVARNRLTDRNANVPAGLPAVWAGLGHADRAEALARSITSAERRVRALAGLAVTAVESGDLDRARRLAEEAETLARAAVGRRARIGALAGLASAAVESGDPDWARRLSEEAETLARSIADPEGRDGALAEVAAMTAWSGDLDRAEALACSIADPYEQASILRWLAAPVAEAGDPDRSRRLVEQAEILVRPITDPYDRSLALAELAVSVAKSGDLGRARRLAEETESLAQLVTDPYQRAVVLIELAAVAAHSGDLDRAETIARSTPYSDLQDVALTQLASVAARSGDLDRAETLARSTTGRRGRAEALAELAAAVAESGDPGRARRLAEETESLAQSITDSYRQSLDLVGLAAAVAQLGDRDRARRLAEKAESLARSITNPYQRVLAPVELAAAVAQLGDPDWARRLTEEAETFARSVVDHSGQAAMLAELTAAVAEIGDLDRAETLARSITAPRHQARALAGLATMVAKSGDPGRARGLVEEAESLARAVADVQEQARALDELTAAVTEIGDLDHAEELARSIVVAHQRACALAELATAAAKSGDLGRARRLVEEAEPHSRSDADSYDQRAWALSKLVIAVAHSGDLDRAETLERAVAGLHTLASASAELAAVMAESGDVDRAETFARAVADPRDQAFALERVARFAEPARARRLVAQALCEVSWRIGLDVVARIQPDAVIALAREFLADG
ncbi:hypothetical protein GCM10017600_82030 [Streptosporangium carneum]|uniref:MalT-like TPR region domain-containing protein n=2 Tax=Streptosporangium carneum TaxID=47481 RepID=A0A9W6I9W7_9ACTN|nr:hypothetical protein GCM10017600_82030 [Streptosporangium carneum]